MKLSLTVSCLLAVAVSVKSDGWGGDVYAPGHASVDYYAYPKYAFEYSVKDPHTGDNKAQWEKRDGDVVKGAYSLVEPDGSLRVVEYWADDKSGFNAVVKRIGPNLHPTGVHVEPIYKAPIPTLGHGPIGPISVGPVAKYEGLAHAPYITGPIHGGAISTASLIKDELPIIKPLHHKEPLLIKEPLLLKEPLLWNEPIMAKEPLWREPIIAKEPLWREPYLAKEPIWNEPLHGKEHLLLNKPILWKQPIPLLKESFIPVSPWGKGLIEDVGHGYGGYESRGYGGEYGGRGYGGEYGGRGEYGGYGGRDGYGWGAPRWGGPKH